MAGIASLSNFSVPTEPGGTGNQALLMPKLKYRFRVTFEGFGIDTTNVTELTRQVSEAARPTLTFDDKTIDVYNSTIHYAGKPKWGAISVKIRDDQTNVVNILVGEQNQKQFDFFEQSSAASGIDYKFTTVIELLDGGNGANEAAVLETFELYGCYVKKAEYKGAEYKTSEAMDITLSIAYDNALQVNTAGQPVGIGAQVGRTVRTLATG